MKKWKTVVVGVLALAVSLTFAGTPFLGKAAEESGKKVETPSRVTVHDPSIIKADGMYYVFGSHMADAKSTNLIDWKQINTDWNARETSDAWKQDSIYGDVLKNYARSFEWAGYDDGDCSNGGLAIWAPDVIYNPYYKWKDGNRGAYMLYYCASSTWRRSCIGYAVAKTVEGPYRYVDTVIYSGFSNVTGKYDGTSIRDTYWDNDYLNIRKLIDNGTIEDVSENWFTSTGEWKHAYAPNAIDPTVFFDKDNNMYMVYGSWSGGLFMQSINRETGEVNYPGKDGTEAVSGNVIDRYFGTRIAGGNGQSGEGPYILYDETTDYYYLYESYGGLTATGGYNMRMFRSKNVYGPYQDAAGRNAKDSLKKCDNYGIKLIGNYQFKNQPGYRAAGHNSALVDEDGSHYLVYHQRFKDKSTHEVRIRQQFLNEDNWPVSAVYEYRGEKIGHYTNAQVIGRYEWINHGTNTDGKMLPVKNVELLADGTITGDVTGTWEKSVKEGNAYDYVTMKIGDVTYKGFFYEQQSEKKTEDTVMTFSAIGNDNTCVWGSHKTQAEVAAEIAKEEAAKDTPTPAPTTIPTAKPTNTSAYTQNDSLTPKDQKVESLKKTTLIVKAKKKKALLSWKKVSGAKGYQIQYALNKKFKKAKKLTIKRTTVKKVTIKKLKKGKKYYFRIRAYQVVKGKKVYSSFSKIVTKRI